MHDEPRRNFLIQVVAVAATLLGVKLPARMARSASHVVGGSEVLWLPRSKAAYEVGSAFLAQHPYEADPVRITTGLLRVVPLLRANRQRAREAFRKRVQYEFDIRETVSVGGWVLARSEALAAALYVLEVNPSSTPPRASARFVSGFVRRGREARAREDPP